MISELEIREKLLAVLTHEVSLADFSNWIGQRSWNMHLDSEPRAQELVGVIELALAEYSLGHLTDAELCERLQGEADFVSSGFSFVTTAITPITPSHQRATASWYQVPSELVRFLVPA